MFRTSDLIFRRAKSRQIQIPASVKHSDARRLAESAGQFPRWDRVRDDDPRVNERT
jgi:hypothetical protein